MRSWLSLILALAWVTIPATAEKPQKPKAKPTHSEEKEGKGSAKTVKPPTNRNSSSQELRKIEQSSAKTPGARKGDSSKAPRTAAVVKPEKQERNPPIQFSSGGGGGKGSKGKGSDPYKGRLKHKGAHH